MRLDKAELPDMGDDGEIVRQRREALGLSQAALGREADPEDPIHRNTIAAIERGQSGHRAKLVAVLRALDRLEVEAGIDAPPLEPPEPAEPAPAVPRNVVISLGEGQGRVVIEGPVEDLVELEAAAERLFRLAESR